ncbi:DeoR/GlpR family DNA-binding transcription regulator [Mongoliimonas terrestris]|uniref:DeoR/GlpR family DNA-binding transcription regulator n=1 Tax=Mongoliimonas terrestris TaxID=1709001 RepID=UPI0009499907|nr:DeoR/GlpR family DNA-binding transcription regulator [Mongoliimonas terrestris]
MNVESSLPPAERRNRIEALARERARLPVTGLAARFGTSEDSIRRDLRLLAAAGRIRRQHGVVLPADPPAPFDERREQRAAEKAAIGRALVPMLVPGSTVFFDGGTTTLAAARALPADLRLTVVTTSPPVALALVDHAGIEVILVGGSFDRKTRTVVGAGALDAVRAVHADLAVLGLCSLDVGGVSAAGIEEAAIKRAMADASDRTVALATADKLGTISPHRVMAAERLQSLISCEPPAVFVDAFGRIGVTVIDAPR